jgi:hypothetical protein
MFGQEAYERLLDRESMPSRKQFQGVSNFLSVTV